MNTRFKNAVGWLLLAWCFAAGVVAWVSKKTEKVSAVLIVSGYSAILVYGLFFRSREELRKAKVEYIGFAAVLVFWLFLSYAVFVK